MFHATTLLTECFDTNGVHYQVASSEDSVAEIVEVPCPITGGPTVRARFISTDDDNDVGVRIYSLVTSVQEEKRMAVLEACNRLNATYRFITFELDRDNDVSVAFDLPVATSDECLGHSVMEILARIAGILEDAYPLLMEVLHGKKEDQLSPSREVQLYILRRILYFLDNPEKHAKFPKLPREEVQAMIERLESEAEDEDNGMDDEDLPC